VTSARNIWLADTSVAAVSPCLGDDTIMAFLEHRLDSVRAARFEQHLAACSACRRLVSESARTEMATARGARLASVPPPPEPLSRGTVIGRYMVVSLLGRGGMGVVYRAYDPDLNRQVAVKLVGLGGLGSDVREQARQRLMREAQALAKLSHPNVVVVHDVGTIGDDVFIAMELVEGVTLRAWLAEAPRTPREILRVFRCAGEGLAAAHEVGVVHRDFKPDNVMVGRDGRVRVLDFGLARLAASPRISRRSLSAFAPPAGPELTHAGAMLGTPAYMSPEQDAGLEAGESSDQFSFCVALYEALFGGHPHRGDSYLEVARSRAGGDIAVPPKLRGLSSGIRRAVLIGLRPQPAERHASIRALLAELEPHALSSPRRIAAVAVAALAVGGGGAWLLLRSTAPSSAAACAFVEDEGAKLWGPERRAKLAATLANVPNGAAAAAKITGAVDRWAADWTSARRALCVQSQTAAADSANEAHGAEQLQCLERRRTEVDALLTLISTSDPMIVDKTKDSVTELRPPGECKNLESSPLNEREKELAMPVVRQVLKARLAINAAKLDEALGLARAAVDTARATHSQALAFALQTLGDTENVNGNIEHARESYRAAAVAAAEIHEDGMVADAWLALVSLSFRDHKLDKSVDEGLFAAKLATTRSGEASDRVPMLHYVTGTVDVMRGDLDAAIPELEQAIAGWERDPRKNIGNLAPAHNSLGMAYADKGAWDASKSHLERALASMREIGKDIPQVGTVLANLAVTEVYQDHFDAAEAYMRQTLAIYDKLRPDHPLVAEGALNMGMIYAESGRCAQARPLLDKARAALEPDKPALAMVLLEQGRCARDPSAGLALLDRALAIAKQYSVSPREVPEIEFAQAQQLDRRRERARAVALAQEARAGFVKVGAGTSQRTRHVDAWLAPRTN
jgi:eukaryotic-like serine/threonine-protein kinase